MDAALAEFITGRTAALRPVGEELLPLVEAARSFVLDGGKRLRPTLAYWGWRATGAGGEDTPLVILGGSLELLHACALVHDDVMDASDTRRGRPAAHASFAAIHRDAGWTGDADVFGTAAAILLGDLLLSWADAMFADAALDEPVLAATRRVYYQMRQLVTAGQYLDVLVQARGGFSVTDALRVAEFKTSKYTVEGPLHLGAAAAGATPETVAALAAYGLPLGEAFQLRDDVLGVFGDPVRTGKPAGDDLREGKRTLLVALAMERADAGQAELLGRELGNRAMAESTVQALCEIVVSTTALARVEQRILTRTAEARQALRAPALDPAAAAALDALAVAAAERTT